MSKKYRPSNGTEGMAFMDKYCDNCLHENPDPRSEPNCDILSLSMLHDVDEKEYPEEWTYNDQGTPTCTSFQKWDWDSGDDPPPPLEPVPDNQLCLPFEIDLVQEVEKNEVERQKELSE